MMGIFRAWDAAIDRFIMRSNTGHGHPLHGREYGLSVDWLIRIRDAATEDEQERLIQEALAACMPE